MYIYKITNLINSKTYIGRTTAKNPLRRWTEHKSKSKRNPRTPIEYALQKHGIENFNFEVINKCRRNQDLANIESKYILLNNSLSPNGYNLEVYQPLFVKTKESKIKSSISSQGIRRGKKNPYLGMYKSRGKFFSEIRRNREKISKSHNSAVEAAITYDKLALYLYGNEARINFEDKRELWIGDFEMLKKHYETVTFRKPKTQTNIYFDSKRKQWRARMIVNKKVIYIGGFQTFELATKAKELALKNYEN